MLFGKCYYYIKSAGIYFPISKDSADAILATMVRLAGIKKYVEEADEEQKEIKQEDIGESPLWQLIKIPIFSNEEITVSKEARGVERDKYGITWFMPYKEEK